MASLAEIRAQNPQYNDMSDKDLADALHRKFYSDVPKDQFYSKIGLGAAPAPKSAEQTQAEYLRSYGNYPSDDPSAVGRPDMLRENPSDPLTKATGFLGQYVDAAMLGGADEALAGIRSLSPNLTFKNELERLEQKRRDYSADNPEAATAGTVAGVVANPLNVVGGEFIAAGRSAIPRMGRATFLGGMTGGVTGALSTEGGAGERATGAAIGAGLGGAAGLLGQPGAELLGLGGKKATEGARAILNTLRNQSQAHSNPDLQADRLLARAFLQDQLQLGHGPAPLPNALPGQGLINMGGENVQKLGRLSTVAPGEARTIARNFFDEQMGGQADRAADALGGLSQRGYYGTLETLDATRRQAAAPLYDAAYARPAVDVWTPRIGELMNRPSMRAAYARANRIAQEEGRNPTELGLTLNEAGDPVFLAGARNGQIPSTHTLDYVKRGLDDVMQAQPRDPATGRVIMNEETRAIDGTRRELVGILREQNPEYRAALDAWAGPSHSIEVMDLGRDMFKKAGDPADMIRRFRALPEADQEYARIGFMREAINKAGNISDGGSAYQALFNTNNKRALTQTMFPDEASFNRFATQMRAERDMVNANRSTIGGSPTSRIDSEKSDAAMQGASDVLSFAQAIKSSNPLQLLGLAVDKAQNLGRGITPEVADALANRLFTNDPVQIQRVLSRVGAVPAPAPQTALQPGMTQFGRRTPLVPLAAMFGGQGGAAIATPPLGR
jgi:hypothetical protein